MVIRHPVPRTPRIENLADVFLAASNLPVVHHRTPAWLPEAPTDSVAFDEETPAPPELPGEVLRSGCWGHLRLLAHAGQGGFGRPGVPTQPGGFGQPGGMSPPGGPGQPGGFGQPGSGFGQPAPRPPVPGSFGTPAQPGGGAGPTRPGVPSPFVPQPPRP